MLGTSKVTVEENLTSGARGVWWRDGKTERPTEFAMVKAFIGESKEWDRFRSDKTCSSGLYD